MAAFEESIGEIEFETEDKSEEIEKTICARLSLTNEQDQGDKSHQMEEIINTSCLEDVSPAVKLSEDEREIQIKQISTELVFTKKQENDLREAFSLLDHNGEGKIKAEDFRVVIKALGYEPTNEELQNMINGVDKRNTGKLSFEDFMTAIMRKVMSQDTDGDIMKSFRLFDMDDCGAISFDNLKKVTEILDTHLADEEIEEMMNDADKDFDGFISEQEFMKMIKNCVHIVTP